jgi:hypothetical protein
MTNQFLEWTLHPTLERPMCRSGGEIWVLSETALGFTLVMKTIRNGENVFTNVDDGFPTEVEATSAGTELARHLGADFMGVA